MADHVGKQLGNYHLICLLGQGGFADVYLGEHVYLKTMTAIKVLQTRLLNEDFEAFLNEARTIASLKHPHIIQVLDFGIEDDMPFLVMEYASNGTLRQRYPKGAPLPLDSIVSYAKQAASALQYAHDRKLIHRDVKPENMLLGANNDILLSDFGLVLMAQSSLQQNTQDAIGTLAYMAPEQLQGKPRPASDQYALGVVVYEWLSGDRPFHGNFTEIASQHMLVAPPPLHEKVPTIAPEIERVVHTALAKDPHWRFASVQKFAMALEQAILSSASRRGITPAPDQLYQPPAEAVPIEQISTTVTPPSASQALRTPVLTPPDQSAGVTLDRSSLSTSLLPPAVHAPYSMVNLPSVPTSVPGQLPVATPSQGALPAFRTTPSGQLIQSPEAANSFGQLPSVTWGNQPPFPRTMSSPLSPLPPEKPQQGKRGSSRRAFIWGLAGLAGLTLAGSGVALLVQASQTSTIPLNPTPTQLPTTNPTQIPIATEAPTPTPTPKPKPTATHATGTTPTPTPRPTPTPTPSQHRRRHQHQHRRQRQRRHQHRCRRPYLLFRKDKPFSMPRSYLAST